MEPIRIVIADDHPLFRDGLRVLLESVPDMQVMGEATTGNEILTFIAQRKSNAEIAARLVLSPKTVRNHVSNILSKLQVADRTEAMHAAWTAGLGQENREGA